MKKVVALIILASTLLTGCAAAPGPSESAVVPEGSGMFYEEVISNLEDMLKPLGDQYQMTLLPKVDLDDGSISRPVVVTDTILKSTYHIHLYHTKSGEVYMFSMDVKTGSHTDLAFALLSYYLYKSMGLPEMEAQDFYDYFSLLTEEPEGYLSTDGWGISASTLTNFLHFSGLYKAQ